MRFYLFLRPRRWRVTVYLHRDHSFDWYRISGVTLGRWFIGAIQGSPSTPDRGD